MVFMDNVPPELTVTVLDDPDRIPSVVVLEAPSVLIVNDLVPRVMD